jgi:integrase
MPPQKRNKINRGLPTGWRFRCGAYRYRVPQNLRHLWDGKSEYTLGKTLPEAHRTWAEKLEYQRDANTISQLLDQYLLQVVPDKSWKSQESNRHSITRLRSVFGHMPIVGIEPHHVYKYISKVTKKHGATSARRDWEVLRHVYTKSVEWGLIKAHPLLGQVRIAKPPPRTRYIEDWELETALTVAPPLIAAYIELKLLTGLRRKDILLLRWDDLREDGIHVKPTKTAKTSGKKLIIEWSEELVTAVDIVREIPRKVGSIYLFPTRSGKCYIDEKTGRANGFDSLWRRWMLSALKTTDLTERFQERDLRAKSASDDTDIESARRRLGHTSEQITKTVYRRKGEVVQPLKRAKSGKN